VLVVLYTLGAIATMLLLALALIGLRYLTRGTPVASVSDAEGNRKLPQTDDELRQFWIASAEAGIAGAAGRLCLLTATRRNDPNASGAGLEGRRQDERESRERG